MENIQALLEEITGIGINGEMYFAYTLGKSHTYAITQDLYQLLSFLFQLKPLIFTRLAVEIHVQKGKLTVENKQLLSKLQEELLLKKLETEVNIYFQSQLSLMDQE